MPRVHRTLIACLALALAACNQNGEGPEVLPVATVVIDELAVALMPGGTVQLVARALGPNGETLSGRAITFSGGNSIVASVSPTGLVTAIAPGTVIMHASAEGQTGDRDIPVNYPVPTVTSITPSSVPSETAVTIAVLGTGYYAGTAVRMNGVARLTTVVSTGEVRFNLSAADVATTGTLAISVFSPTPGGGSSESLPLSVVPNDMCDVAEPLTLGTPVDGALETTDCERGSEGRSVYHDHYGFSAAEPMGVIFSVTSDAFDPNLRLIDQLGGRVMYAITSAARPGPAVLRVLVPARALTAVLSFQDQLGAYRMASTWSTTPTITNCDAWFVIPPFHLAETVTAEDCMPSEEARGALSRVSADNEWFWDRYLILLRGGQTITITLESTTFDAALWLYDGDGPVAEDDSGGGGTNARIVFKAPGSPDIQRLYTIEAGPSTATGAIGAYILRIN